MNRCAVSIPSNILEGKIKSTNKKFSNYLEHSLDFDFKGKFNLVFNQVLPFRRKI